MTGAHMVFIQPNLVKRLNLPVLPLPKPEYINVALEAQGPTSLAHYIELSLCSCDKVFHSKVLHTVISPKLCMPLIFGFSLLERKSHYL